MIHDIIKFVMAMSRRKYSPEELWDTPHAFPARERRRRTTCSSSSDSFSSDNEFHEAQLRMVHNDNKERQERERYRSNERRHRKSGDLRRRSSDLRRRNVERYLLKPLTKASTSVDKRVDDEDSISSSSLRHEVISRESRRRRPRRFRSISSDSNSVDSPCSVTSSAPPPRPLLPAKGAKRFESRMTLEFTVQYRAPRGEVCKIAILGTLPEFGGYSRSEISRMHHDLIALRKDLLPRINKNYQAHEQGKQLRPVPL